MEKHGSGPGGIFHFVYYLHVKLKIGYASGITNERLPSGKNGHLDIEKPPPKKQKNSEPNFFQFQTKFHSTQRNYHHLLYKNLLP